MMGFVGGERIGQSRDDGYLALKETRRQRKANTVWRLGGARVSSQPMETEMGRGLWKMVCGVPGQGGEGCRAG